MLNIQLHLYCMCCIVTGRYMHRLIMTLNKKLKRVVRYILRFCIQNIIEKKSKYIRKLLVLIAKSFEKL